jgi:hypothetical protein
MNIYVAEGVLSVKAKRAIKSGLARVLVYAIAMKTGR